MGLVNAARLAFVVAAGLLAGRTAAHHSASIFDTRSVVAFEGTVTRFTWTNPHVYIHVATRDEAGETIEWEIETDATPILTRSGWTAESLVPGDRVSVRANPDRNIERRHALLVSIAKQDGAVFSARSYFLRKPDDALRHCDNALELDPEGSAGMFASHLRSAHEQGIFG